MENGIGRELNWDDEIEVDGSNFEPLPEGDYDFTIERFERSRSAGSEKLPPCNMAVVYFSLHGYDRDVTVRENFVLHERMEWKLSELFRSVGLKKEGERVRMQWNALPGLSGRCKVVQKPGIKDPSRMYNAIDTLYTKENKSYKAGTF